MKKKVLFVANVYGHLYAFHRPYIQMLKDNGCQVDVIAAHDNREVANADNCYYWDLIRSPFSLQNIKAYKQLKTLIETEKYDLVHCHTFAAATLTRLAVSSIRKKIGIKVLYTAHGLRFWKDAPRWRWLLYYHAEKYLSRFTDGIVLINTEDFNMVLNSGFHNLETYYIAGIGINSKRFSTVDAENGKKIREEEGYISNQFLMIYVAEYINRKNHKFLVDASLELAKKIDKFKILFVGRGKLEQEIRKYAISVGANKYIDFLGVRYDLDRLLPMCDVGVSSSRREGLPMAVAEKMLCGLPILATQERGHHELVIHGETGFLYKQEDINDFVKYAIVLYNDPVKRLEMGKAAYLHAQKFKIEHSLKRMADIYSELLQITIEFKANYIIC